MMEDILKTLVASQQSLTDAVLKLPGTIATSIAAEMSNQQRSANALVTNMKGWVHYASCRAAYTQFNPHI